MNIVILIPQLLSLVYDTCKSRAIAEQLGVFRANQPETAVCHLPGLLYTPYFQVFFFSLAGRNYCVNSEDMYVLSLRRTGICE